MVYAGESYVPGDLLKDDHPKRSLVSARKVRWVDVVTDENGGEIQVPGVAPPGKVGDPSVDHSDPVSSRREGQTVIPSHPPEAPVSEGPAPATVDEIIQKGFSRDSAEDIVLLVLDGMSLEDAEAQLAKKQQDDHDAKRVQPGGLYADKVDSEEPTKPDGIPDSSVIDSEFPEMPTIGEPAEPKSSKKSKKRSSKK